MKFGAFFSLLTSTGVLLVQSAPMAMDVDYLSEERLAEILQSCGSHTYDVMLLKESLSSYKYSMIAMPDGTNHENCQILGFDFRGVKPNDPATVAAGSTNVEIHFLGQNSFDEVYEAFQFAHGSKASLHGSGTTKKALVHLEHMHERLGYETNDAILNFIAEGPSAERRLGRSGLIRRLLQNPISTMNEARLADVLKGCGPQMYEVMLMKESLTSFEFSMVAIPDGTNHKNCPILDFDIAGVIESTPAAVAVVAEVGEFYLLGDHSLSATYQAFQFANESGATTVLEHLEHMYEQIGHETNDAILNFIAEGPSQNRRLRGAGFVRFLI